MKMTNILMLYSSRFVTILGLSALFIQCTSGTSEVKPDSKNEAFQVNTGQSEADLAGEIIWNVKAIHPEGRTLDVKALDVEGNLHDVKAIQDSDQRQFLDIKAIFGEDKLPVKMLVSDNQYAPVKAIGDDGTIYDIKAITPDGRKLDVKGVSRSGNIIHIKAIDKEGTFYGIKAISPDGQLNDVKGVKMHKEDRELIVNGVEVYAHVKALPQVN